MLTSDDIVRCNRWRDANLLVSRRQNDSLLQSLAQYHQSRFNQGPAAGTTHAATEGKQPACFHLAEIYLPRQWGFQQGADGRMNLLRGELPLLGCVPENRQTVELAESEKREAAGLSAE